MRLPQMSPNCSQPTGGSETMAFLRLKVARGGGGGREDVEEENMVTKHG